MAIIAILVLLAAPRFLGRTEDAMTNRIKNDIRVAETKLDEYLIRHENLDNWESSVPRSELEDHQSNGALYDREGLMDDDASIEDGDYSRVPTDFIRDMVQSALDGAFYSNEEGNVYYHADRGSQGSGGNNEAPDASENPFAGIPGVSDDYDPTTDWNGVPDGSDGAYPEWTDQELFAYVIEDDSTARITGYYGANPENSYPVELDVVIPEYITEGGTDYPVTYIGGHYGQWNDAYDAFSYFHLPAVLERGSDVVDSRVYIPLESVHVPNTVKKIADSSFGVDNRWDDNPEDYATAMYIGKNVEHIEDGAFWRGRYTVLSTPANMVNLENYAFSHITAEKVIIQSIGTTDAEWSDPSDHIVAANLFTDSTINTIVMMDGIQMLSDDMFFRTQFDNLILPNAYTMIGSRTFTGSSLTSITIPDSVTYLAEYAFGDSDIGGEIVIPESITHIPKDAFYKMSGNSKLTHVEFRGNITEIGAGAFSGNALTEITLPDSLTTIGQNAFWNNNLSSLVLPDALTTIGRDAFNDNDISELTLGPFVEEIGDRVFSGNNIGAVVLPNSLSSLGSGAFYGNSLEQLTIPESITTLESGVFQENNIEELVLPETLTEIKASAFRNNNLEHVYIPDSVESIGNGAFEGNPLQTISVSANTEIAEWAASWAPGGVPEGTEIIIRD